MTITLIAETSEHAEAIDALLDRSFGPARFAKTSERVRERGAVPDPDVTRIAVETIAGGVRVRGVCRMWSVSAGASALLLGPLAVDPDVQHQGLGADLVRACLSAASASGADAVITVGRAAFFTPLGFSLVPRGRLTLPGPTDWDRFLWIGLVPGALDRLHGPVGAPR